uniref:Methyltransferase n=1 Tax=Mycobacterium leprae TaxID=1769 RepID=O69465_MYCLR|nr:hypothetical protein MLCB1243.09 [Mycobacterium leprae]
MKDGSSDHCPGGCCRGAGGSVWYRCDGGRRFAGGAELTRIIGGVARGRRIVVPQWGARPTTDRVRESLFNIVAAQRELTGLAVLDLYAGSGALGLEALSRGAASTLFVESDKRTVAVIERNVTALGLVGARPRCGPVATVLAAGTASPMDLVLADPPYAIDTAEVEAVLATLTTYGWARPGTVAVIERGAASVPLTWPAGWSSWQSRGYGDTRLELAELT